MAKICIDGEDLPYLDLGQRNAPPLIFINGALLTMDFWKYHSPVFAQHFRTIVYDYRLSGPRVNNAEGLTAASLPTWPILSSGSNLPR